MGSTVEEAERLSVPEMRAALEQMSAADWARAERNAAMVARGLIGMSGEDVLDEVVTQLLANERRFPRGQHPLVVLKTAARSVADNARRSAWQKQRRSDVAVEPECDPDDSGATNDVRPVARAAIQWWTPEDEVLAEEQLDAFLTAIEDDPNAQLVAMAWADGSRGVEGLKATGLEAKAYDSARNRVLRRDPRGDQT